MQCTLRFKGVSSHGPECVCYMVHAESCSSHDPVARGSIRLYGSGGSRSVNILVMCLFVVVSPCFSCEFLGI